MLVVFQKINKNLQQSLNFVELSVQMCDYQNFGYD